MLLLRIEVPDTPEMEAVDSLPADPKVFRQLGDEWLEAGKTAILRVPSVLAPRQWNLTINPEHPLAAAIQIAEKTPFAFDSRLLSSILSGHPVVTPRHVCYSRTAIPAVRSTPLRPAFRQIGRAHVARRFGWRSPLDKSQQLGRTNARCWIRGTSEQPFEHIH